MNDIANTVSSENKPDVPAIVAQVIGGIEESNPGLLNDIQNKEEIISGILSVVSSFEIEQEEHHSGPLPAPRTLKGYDEIVPNGAERIVNVFEKQSDHRITLEAKVIGRQTFQSLLGQIFGFVIALIFLFAGIYLVEKGYEVAGITVFGLDIVGLATVFVIGRREQKKNLDENK